jgi:hypothetical protein
VPVSPRRTPLIKRASFVVRDKDALRDLLLAGVKIIKVRSSP